MSENRPKPYLGNPQETIAVLNRYKFAFQKKFGQNFLIDTHVLERIIDEAGITPDDFVLEIGPGIGTMTQYLACAAREVVAVEIDKVLIPILEGDTLKAFDNVTVINEDILKVDINKLVEEKNGAVCAGTGRARRHPDVPLGRGPHRQEGVQGVPPAGHLPGHRARCHPAKPRGVLQQQPRALDEVALGHPRRVSRACDWLTDFAPDTCYTGRINVRIADDGR